MPIENAIFQFAMSSQPRLRLLKQENQRAGVGGLGATGPNYNQMVQITTGPSKNGPNYNQQLGITRPSNRKLMQTQLLHQCWQYVPHGQPSFNAGCNFDRFVSVVCSALLKDIKNSRIHRKFVYVFRGYPELGAISSNFSKLRSPLPGQSRPLAASGNIMAGHMRSYARCAVLLQAL